MGKRVAARFERGAFPARSVALCLHVPGRAMRIIPESGPGPAAPRRAGATHNGSVGACAPPNRVPGTVAMYLPSHFAETRIEPLHAAIRAQPLGLLITLAGSGLQANPIPFLVDAGPTPLGTLRGHVARANPLWRDALADTEALIVFQGPQAYISPSMYPSKAATGKVVPTWNYVTVQARGRLRAIDDAAWVRGIVERLTQTHEAARPVPWAVSDAPGDYIETMLRAIVGIEIELTALQGKWKVSQNRDAADRQGVVYGLEQQARAQDDALAMAAWVARGRAD
jgi:transcriptional regulator